MKRFLVALSLFCILLTARAQGLDDQYVQIYAQIQQADSLKDLGQPGQAAVLYQEALTGLNRIKAATPTWNPQVITFRINDVSEKLAKLRKEPVPAKVTAEAQPAAENVDWAKQAAMLTERVRGLEAEKVELSAKLKEALSVQTAAANAAELAKAQESLSKLQKDNETLKASLDQAKASMEAAPKGISKDKYKKDIAAIEERLASAKAKNDEMKKENESLKASLDQAKASVEAAPKGISKDKYKKDITELEERLAAANAKSDDLKKQLADLDSKAKSSSKGDPAREIASLRARLRIYEARPEPFTAEELAALKQAEPAIASTNTVSGPSLTIEAPAVADKTAPKPAKKSHQELPPGAGPLMADAERDFASHRFDQSQQKFLQVLAQGEDNLKVLYYVAACQIQLDNRPGAEKTVQHALTIDPNDEPTLALLGTLRYQEDKYEEAFSALSRAVELDPKDAAAQNLLGATLAQKGQRGAAETALRKALQLTPDFADAHYNLALIYSKQNPPFTHLARFHYQKALNLGHRPNAELDKLLTH